MNESEIISCRQKLREILDDLELGGKVDADYMMHLKDFCSRSVSSSTSFKVNDEEDDVDPQYKLFLENLKVGGEEHAYKLDIVIENRVLSIVYEGKDDLDEEYDIRLIRNLNKVPNAEKTVEAVKDQDIINDKRRKVNNLMDKTPSPLEATKYTNNNPSGGKGVTRSSLKKCCNKTDSVKRDRSKLSRELKSLTAGNSTEDAYKDSKNLRKRKEMETSKNLRSSVRKCTANTRKDMSNNVGIKVRNLAEEKGEKGFKSKCTNQDQGKTDECVNDKPQSKSIRIFGSDIHIESDADDVDECYRVFLNSVSIEGDCVVYAIEGHNPVKQEQFDIDDNSDSEVFVTNDVYFDEKGHNPFQPASSMKIYEQKPLQIRGEHCLSWFKETLLSKLREPYDEREYKKLWKDINERKRKVGHKDLRGGREKSFLKDEKGPSYLQQHGYLRKKLVAAGHDRHMKLNLLRGFFFWLQNVAHPDSFQPWGDKTCLAVMPENQ